jgi:DNA mismatch repair protein MutS
MDFCLILKTALKKTMDLDRFLSNCSLGSADARGLVWLRSTLETLSLVNLEMSSRTLPGCFQEIATAISRGLGATVSLYQSLVITYVEEPAPLIVKVSRTFKEGFCHELDEIISLESGLDQKLQALEDFEKKKCGISTLKIGYRPPRRERAIFYGVDYSVN